MLVTLVDVARYLTALRSLLYIMRETHPLLCQQVDGPGFFSASGNMMKEVRRYHYDDLFVGKCGCIRQLFMLSMSLLGVMMLGVSML